MTVGIFTAGHQCAPHVAECIRSVREQTNANWRQVIVDDASTDGTFQVATREAGGHPRIRVLANDNRKHSNFSILRAIDTLVSEFLLVPEDVLMCLDLDDMLAQSAVDRVISEHRAGAWVTYGNWKDQGGGLNPHVPHSAAALASIRNVKWFLTHALSFRVGVFQAIPREFFKWKGTDRHYETGFDASVMLPAVDLAGPDRVRGIPEAIYVYRRNHSGSVLRTWSADHRVKIFADQRSKHNLQRMETL